MKSFDIVIVNWNSGKQLEECIESINSANKDNCNLNKIIIIDNASDDDSLQFMHNYLKKTIVIKNNKNMGFGKACNQGAKYSNSDFILFLNPDTLIFKNTFLNLFKFLEKNDNNSIAVYGVQLLDEIDNIQRNCARIPTLFTFIIRSLGLNKLNSKLFKSYTMENWNHSETKIVDQVMGSFFMIKNDIFQELDGFDERFFVYYEELDLSKRVKDLKYKTLFVAEAQAYHKGGGTSENVKAKRLFYNTRSRLLYAFKHFGFIQGIILMLFTFIVEPITRTIFLLIKSKPTEVKEMLLGFSFLYLDSISIIKNGLKN